MAESHASTLEDALLSADSNAVSDLIDVKHRCRVGAEYFSELVVLCFDARPNVSGGATWILKSELEDGAQLPDRLVDRIAYSLKKLSSWQAQLHICQSVEMFRLTDEQAKSFLMWAETLAEHPRPFLRAWSLNARVILGRDFEDYRDAAIGALDHADGDNAASVRARARQLRKLIDEAR